MNNSPHKNIMLVSDYFYFYYLSFFELTSGNRDISLLGSTNRGVRESVRTFQYYRDYLTFFERLRHISGLADVEIVFIQLQLDIVFLFPIIKKRIELLPGNFISRISASFVFKKILYPQDRLHFQRLDEQNNFFHLVFVVTLS